jgi:hypothetical protein
MHAFRLSSHLFTSSTVQTLELPQADRIALEKRSPRNNDESLGQFMLRAGIKPIAQVSIIGRVSEAARSRSRERRLRRI